MLIIQLTGVSSRYYQVSDSYYLLDVSEGDVSQPSNYKSIFPAILQPVRAVPIPGPTGLTVWRKGSKAVRHNSFKCFLFICAAMK